MRRGAVGGAFGIRVVLGARAGNVADPTCDPIEMENFQEWSKRFPLNMPICLDCPFVTICGGGCPYNAYVSSGSIWNKDPQVCTYLEEMINWILRYHWKKSGMADKHGVKARETLLSSVNVEAE